MLAETRRAKCFKVVIICNNVSVQSSHVETTHALLARAIDLLLKVVLKLPQIHCEVGLVHLVNDPADACVSQQHMSTVSEVHHRGHMLGNEGVVVFIEFVGVNQLVGRDSEVSLPNLERNEARNVQNEVLLPLEVTFDCVVAREVSLQDLELSVKLEALALFHD
jgi:hypothetical protein